MDDNMIASVRFISGSVVLMGGIGAAAYMARRLPATAILRSRRIVEIIGWLMFTCVVCLCVGFLAGVFVMRLVG